MTTHRQELFTHKCSKTNGWDYAISVAKRQIVEAEGKIKQLGLSIKTFQEMREKGEPFPVETPNAETFESRIRTFGSKVDF